jgi:CheY-like chemotaxis protein
MRAAVSPGGARPILVVDDDAAVRQLLIGLLTEEGYRVLDAPDGAAALARVQVTAPSLILLDMRMPVLDGWEFARRYRAGPGPHAPIICVTAAVDAGAVAARGAQIGAVASLSKPFDLDELLAVVRRHVAPAPPAPPAPPA